MGLGAKRILLAVAAVFVIAAGLVSAPAVADDGTGTGTSDDRGLGTPSPSPPGKSDGAALLADAYVFREHSTANHERVDLRDDRISKVQTVHNINFSALVRAVEWARSPRKSTSPDGIDRGIYQYRIYEYQSVNGNLQPTGRWVVIQTVIEWGDGIANRGWLVTAYPVATQSGAPAVKNGKSWAPSWLQNSLVFGPINNDILY